MATERRTSAWVTALTAGVVIGAVEVVLAISFAALVFGGYLVDFLHEGIGIYLVAATITLAGIAWRAGRRGPVGSVQDAAAAVLGLVANTVAIGAFGSPGIAFLTVVATTVIVTVSTGLVFVVVGVRRLGNLVRFVPYPVMGGFLAGTGWLLFKGGIGVASNVMPLYWRDRDDLTFGPVLHRWLPALVFGIVLYLVVRIIDRPLVLPTVIGVGLVLFAVGMLVTGSSIQDAQRGDWLLGPFPPGRLLQIWTFKAFQYADWSAIFRQTAGIATAIFVAVIAALFNISGTELILRKDLDTNEELRDAGFVNIISGAFGGIPGYHALSLTSLGAQMRADPRVAGLVAAVIPFTAVVFGATLIELIPRMIVGGVLVFVGLGFMIDWAWDKRHLLPTSEYVVLLVIFLTIATQGLMPGIAIGLIAAMALFAYNYARVEQVTQFPFGGVYRSNVDRPEHERAALRAAGDRVLILRLHGFIFFGTISSLLERIRRQIERSELRFLVLDLRRTSGLDSSTVVAFRKITLLASGHGFELVLTGASEPVRRLLERGGVTPSDGEVAFEPDLDRGLQRCEDALLAATEGLPTSSAAFAGFPEACRAYAERRSLETGEVLLHQGDAPDDVYIVESGRLRVELQTPEGTAMRLGTIPPGVTVGEIGLYTGAERTADAVADEPSVVLRLSRDAIERIEREDPALAIEVHRWLATTIAQRQTTTLHSLDVLMD